MHSNDPGSRARGTRGWRAIMRRVAAWSALAAAIVAGGAVGIAANTLPAPATTPHSTEEAALGFVEAQLRAQGTPDAAFAVVEDGEVTASGALGDGIDVTTPFLVGSLSKPFTALVILRLVDEGAVDLDAPVTDYLPWFTTADEDVVITIRHLLQQTSGLPTWAGQVDLVEPSTTLEERVRALADVEPVHEPGEAFEYCNKNFATLGLVVESVTGMPYADAVQRHVPDPLAMRHSFTDLDEARAAGLVDGASVWFGAHVPQAPEPYPGALPDGYLVSTVDDLARLAEVLATGEHDGERVLSDASLALMRTAPEGVAPDEAYDARYGLGVRVSTVAGQEVVAHEGELATYRADLGVLPEDGRGLVILSAHNTMLADLGAAYRGGIAVLAGGAAPAVDHGFFAASLCVTVAGAIVLAALLTSAVALVARARGMRARVLERGRARALAVPVVGRLLAAGTIGVGVFLALGLATGQPGFLSPAIAYASAPDVTVIVLSIVGFLALSAIVLLGAGVLAGGPARADAATPARGARRRAR